jgi:hypothetical protein
LHPFRSLAILDTEVSYAPAVALPRQWRAPLLDAHGGVNHHADPSPIPRVLLTKREAAAALGMSLRHFERHVQAHVHCVHSGQLTLYPVRDLERWATDEATIGGRAA